MKPILNSSVCTLLLLFIGAQPILGQQQRLELNNPSGWPIPGMEPISRGRLKPSVEKKRLGDYDVTVSMYVTESATTEDRLARLPFLWHIRDRGNAFLFHEVDVAASRVWIYEFSGHRFGFIVEGARYVYDKTSRTGGFTDELRLVFEDRNGDGKYEVMVQGSGAEYTPAVPPWVGKPGSAKGN